MTSTATEPHAYDLIAIGSGPAGQQAAVQAAALGKRVAAVQRGEREHTLPTRALRAAVVELTGGARRDVNADDLIWRARQMVEHEQEAVARRLRRSGVTVIEGAARFLDPHSVAAEADGFTRILHGDRFVIAVGSEPVGRDEILRIDRLPRTAAIVGAGVIGLEYASMAAVLGIHATVVDPRERLLDFVDDELVEALEYHLRGNGVEFRLGDAVESVSRDGDSVRARLASGEVLVADAAFHAAGRCGATRALNLAAVGLEPDEHGRLAVDAEFRTAVPHVFAAGDVISPSSLAVTSGEHGRLAALAAFGHRAPRISELLPVGLYTIPEIAFVGDTERALADRGTAFVAGRAQDRGGVLKLLVERETRRLLGVHLFGTAATELVHLGQALIAGGLTVDYVAEAPFSVPSFSDAYRLAAVDAIERLGEGRAAA